VNSFLKRAYAVASSYGSMHEDSQPIKTMLMCNGFPANFLGECVRNFLQTIYISVLPARIQILCPLPPHTSPVATGVLWWA